MIRRLLAFLPFLGWGGCAVVQAPPGGPVDSAAVVVVRSVPATGAVSVPRDQVVELQWNKWVQPATLGKSLTISPAPPGRTRLDLDGDVLRLSFAEPLDSPATYSVRFAPGVQDWHDGKSHQEIELAFATGPVMDSGLVEVRAILNGMPPMQAPAGTRVGLYPLDSLRRAGLKRLLKSRDSLAWLAVPPRPGREKPLYSATVDSLGIAHVAHVPPGRYRVVACTDKGGDGFCRPSQDSAALLGEAALVRGATPWRATALLGRMDTAAPVRDTVDSSRWNDSSRDSLRKAVAKADSLARADSLMLDSVTALDTARPADSMAIVLVRDTMLRDSLHGPVPASGLWARAWPIGGRTRPVLRPFVAGRARLPLKPGKWRIEVWEEHDGDGRATPSSLLKELVSEACWLWKDQDFPAGYEGGPVVGTSGK